MGLFDAITGAAGHEAAQNTRNTLAAIVPNLATAGQDAYRNAYGLLQGGYNQARGDLGAGYDAATGAINQGASGALGYLQQGGGAYAPLSALAEQYGKGAGLYADALGINGAQGNQNAVSAFQAGPGYDFALNQGLDAINRRRNAAGSLIGGNADRDAQTYGVGLANQEYGNWLNRLQGYNPLQLSATQGAATGNQANNLAQAAVSSGQGNSLANLAQSYYGGLGQNSVAGGTALANNQIGGAQNWQGVFGNALPQWTGTYKQDADASNSASANALNLGMNIAKLAAGAAGGFGDFGGGVDPIASTGGVRWI